jgi:hypothetical protein
MQVSLKDYMGNEIDDKYVILSAKMTEKSSGERIWLGFRKCGHAVFKSLGTLKRPEACDFRIFVNGKYFKDFYIVVVHANRYYIEFVFINL